MICLIWTNKPLQPDFLIPYLEGTADPRAACYADVVLKVLNDMPDMD